MAISLGALSSGVSSVGGFGKKLISKCVQSGMQLVLPVAICAPAVVSAANLKYDKSAKPVQGTNVDSAVNEAGKQTVNYAGMSVILGVTAGLTAIAPLPLKPLFFVLGNFTALTKYNEGFQEVLPSETKLVAQACKDKGIDYNPESPMGSINNPQGLMA